MMNRTRRRLRAPSRTAQGARTGRGTSASALAGPANDARIRLGAVAGIAGPAAFTAAWALSSLLQAGHSATEVQISGLAAPDARDPWIMIAGFVVLGGCSVGFGTALHAALGGSGHAGGGQAGGGQAGGGPRLIQAAGLLTVAAGLLRRDRMLLTAPAHESWHNHAHDVVSALIYVALVVVPLLLARRFRGDRRWRVLCWPLVAASTATAVVLVVFFAGAFGSSAGLLQRIGVTIPLAAMCAVAVRLLTTGSVPRPEAR
jgi:hypothetical membrane protein